jgi:ABC-type transport system involved in multi-copper enzyme maturation permease subunit
VFIVYFLQQMLFPKMSAIALATCKSEMAQPLFVIILGLGAFALFVFLFIPYNTFGEDIKMLKDSGFSTIMILAIIHAVWAASKSVSEEIEGKTALTVLSKPVGRRAFVFGKFIGIVWSVAIIFVVLGVFFLILIAYKPIYDARESSKMAPLWQESYEAVILTVPGLVLAFMETVVLAAISVAISTRLPMLANFSICFAIYALGHLTPLLVQSSVGNLPPVAFMGLFISAVLPMLEAFNIQAAVAAGQPVPYTYLGAAFLYCCLYSLVAMLLALFLFEDRDLA